MASSFYLLLERPNTLFMFDGCFIWGLFQFILLMFYILQAFGNAFHFLFLISSNSEETAIETPSNSDPYRTLLSSTYELFFIMIGNVDTEVIHPF